MDKYSVLVVMGRGFIVINKSNRTHVFSGTLEECNDFINKILVQ